MEKHNMEAFTDGERELVKYLRDEAIKVKDCFSQYSFQSIAFSGAFFILIATFQRDYPFVGISSLGLLLMVLTVIRIGTHKYATANRQFGFQLYLESLTRLEGQTYNKRKNIIRNIGWEEAMRSWRIIQATTFRNLYHSGFWGLNFLRKK
jgi:hypothetical protein